MKYLLNVIHGITMIERISKISVVSHILKMRSLLLSWNEVAVGHRQRELACVGFMDEGARKFASPATFSSSVSSFRWLSDHL